MIETGKVEVQASGSTNDNVVSKSYLKEELKNHSYAHVNSRFYSDFKHLQPLGKGGFGSVIKVKKKLDCCYYAIKCILLKPNQSDFNKKIIREVKLLSSLNHKNIVRYYNAWIETIEDFSSPPNSSESSTTSRSDTCRTDSGVNVSAYGTKGISRINCSDYSIMFQSVLSVEDVTDNGYTNDDEYEDKNKEELSDSVSSGGSRDNSALKKRLYIQMEYCKSTLQDAIDQGLRYDQDRMWRLYREILEGLAHVHQQNIIHRDLKPQNIFLDANDHVKIGDFGLATSHAKLISSHQTNETSSGSEGGDSNFSGVVGTVFYIAPEVNNSSKRTRYTQKVDIYSLGIIFFEMYYSAFSTSMERAEVLKKLRMSTIEFPSEFEKAKFEREGYITKWCLDHEPSQRPTALELLECPSVPTRVFAESDILAAVRKMLADPCSKQRLLIIDEVFKQAVEPIPSIACKQDQHHEQKQSVSHLVLIREEDEKTVTVKSLSRNNLNFTENKVLSENLVDFLKQRIQGIDKEKTVKKYTV